MKIFLDNALIQTINSPCFSSKNHPLLSDQENELVFPWPSFLECVELSTLFSTLPSFQEGEPLFEASLISLYGTEEKDLIYAIYDRLFAENLTQIKNLPQINAQFLLRSIQNKKEVYSKENLSFFNALEAKEKQFIEKEKETMHDLILYLSWDRMCAWMSSLFDHQSTNPLFIHNITLLKECLIESYQHIKEQKKTSPGIYRMLEALFSYEMREENLQNHTEKEWAILNKGFHALKTKNELMDFLYIENAYDKGDLSEIYLTLDSAEKIQTRIALADHFTHKLKETFTGWELFRSPKNILYLKL